MIVHAFAEVVRGKYFINYGHLFVFKCFIFKFQTQIYW